MNSSYRHATERAPYLIRKMVRRCMNGLRAASVAWVLFGLGSTLRSQPATNALSLSFSDVHYATSAPYASDAALARRLGIKAPPVGYHVEAERFRLGVASDYATNRSYGLLVWVSPGDSPQIPAAWERELARRQVLFVSAYAAGNERNAIDRCRLALDATFNVCRQYRIDAERIYIAGFSGGGRIASILGVSCADVFAGCLAICGVDFYRDVSAGTGPRYPATYRVDPQLLKRARDHGRFVLLTGEFDQNRDNTKAMAENGFKAQQFQYVRYMEVKELRHALPSAAVFATALDALELPGLKRP